jgi:hypothetical protein
MDRSQLTVANEFVRIDYASDAPVFSGAGVAIRFIGPDHAAAALNHNVVFAARYLGRKCDLKLYGRANLQGSIGANVNAGGTEIAGHAARVDYRIFLVNLDRQMQRKPFSGTRFSHDSSSAPALRFKSKPEDQKFANSKLDEQLTALYHGK